MDRHGQPPPKSGGRPVTSKDVAIANENFDQFLNASSLKHILGYYRNICDFLSLKPSQFPLFYPKLKGFLGSWRAKALWKKFDARIGHKCYGKGKICANTRVLVIGGGPCGLRTAIEAQLLGAKVVVIEKRDRLSRNNVLHLWPFVIEDLRMLGAKKFFGKFCAGAIDHISIRQLQCILLKIALLLGVEVHTEVSFERLIDPDPTEKTGWRAEYLPSTHPVSQYEFDVIIGADGKRNTLQGFKRKEFRGKLAIAITANFINKRSEAEAVVEEISGVAFIFNQKFFKDLYEGTGIDLENIVYYKDETHYFVMTAKKPSLLEKGVIVQDLADTERLLAPDNVNREALMDYAKEAASFSTHYQMPNLEFAVNHYGQPDVAMFDFTSMYAAENASKVVERSGYRLLMILVGDSLLEPFWPTGSGCARGFLSSMDAAWAIRSWCLGNKNALDVIAERESIYRLLGQTTPDNLNKDWKAYTLDPSTRYPNLNKNVVVAHQTVALFDTDNPKSIERMRRNPQDVSEVPRKRRRGNVDNDVLLRWISEQVKEHEDIVVSDIASVFKDGKVLSAILSHYRPDLLDYNSLKSEEPQKRNQLVIELFEKEVGISPVMSGEEITETEDYLTMATYLTQIYDTFRCEIPHIKHPKIRGILKNSNRKCTCEVKFWRVPPPPITLPPLPPIPIVESESDEELDIFESAVLDDDELIPVLISPPPFESPKFSFHQARKSRRVIKIEIEKVKSKPAANTVKYSSAAWKNAVKFPCARKKMTDSEENSAVAEPELVFSRVSNWISTHDFLQPDDVVETNLPDDFTDITSVTKCIEKRKQLEEEKSSDGLIVEERTDEIKCGDDGDYCVTEVKNVKEEEEEEEEEDPNEEELKDEQKEEDAEEDPLIKNLSKFSDFTPFKKEMNRTASPSLFTAIVEGEESDLPDKKKGDSAFRSLKPLFPSHFTPKSQVTVHHPAPIRPSSKHKRHIDAASCTKQPTPDRKTRKRRTLDKMGATVICRYFLNAFLESMLIGSILVVLDIFINSNNVPYPEPSWTYFF